jgi:hypothetical protein
VSRSGLPPLPRDVTRRLLAGLRSPKPERKHGDRRRAVHAAPRSEVTRGEPTLSIRRVHAEPESDRGAPAEAEAEAEAEKVGWLALWDDRSITYHRTARALLRAVRQRDRRDAARAERRGDAAIIATVITWNRIPPGFAPPTEDAP